MNDKKDFDNEEYLKFNKPAIKAGVEFLSQLGEFTYDIHPLNQPEAYKSHDFYLNCNGIPIYFEVEVKFVWYKQFVWQGYRTVDVPVRKHESKSELFIMFNRYYNTLAFIQTKNVLNSKIVYKDTCITKNEPFFAVDLKHVKFFKKNNDKWSLI